MTPLCSPCPINRFITYIAEVMVIESHWLRDSLIPLLALSQLVGPLGQALDISGVSNRLRAASRYTSRTSERPTLALAVSLTTDVTSEVSWL